MFFGKTSEVNLSESSEDDEEACASTKNWKMNAESEWWVFRVLM